MAHNRFADAPRSLTRTAARESAAAGIRVNAITPGPVDTALWDQMPADFQARVLATIPLGLRLFVAVERYAKKTGRLKRSG